MHYLLLYKNNFNLILIGCIFFCVNLFEIYSQNDPFLFDYPVVKVKGGRFLMGCNYERDSNRKGKCYEDETEHMVVLSGFRIGKYEVVQAQWEAVMNHNPSHFQKKNGENECHDCPVEQVRWEDLKAFLINLNEKTNKKYRLPTEAEWEFAARGGKLSKGFKYSGSNQLNDVAWWLGNSERKTHPVGQKAPNELGLYDMSGNVWEWCSDAFAPYDLNENKNPHFKGNENSLHILRSGSWISGESNCRIANRDHYFPNNDYQTGPGFRLVLDD